MGPASEGKIVVVQPKNSVPQPSSKLESVLVPSVPTKSNVPSLSIQGIQIGIVECGILASFFTTCVIVFQSMPGLKELLLSRIRATEQNSIVTSMERLLPHLSADEKAKIIKDFLHDSVESHFIVLSKLRPTSALSEKKTAPPQAASKVEPRAERPIETLGVTPVTDALP